MHYNMGGGDKMVEHAGDGSLASGFTPPAAYDFIRGQFPDVAHWMCWFMSQEIAERCLWVVMGEGIHQSGKWGRWTWERVPSAYPPLSFWGGDTKRIKIGSGWTGVVRFKGPRGEDFLLFSYLRFDRRVGHEYLVSTGDIQMLRRFGDELVAHYHRLQRRSKSTVVIDVYMGKDITLDTKDDEPIYLPSDLRTDIESQVFSFFKNRAMYDRLKIPYRRGFLFAGVPGTGKTLMIRRLLRDCHSRFNAQASYLPIKQSTDESDIEGFFGRRGSKGPKILILEDLDSLTTESRVARSALLAQLDGLASMSGVLVLGTTNHPELLDPALTQRPSRFDRVWMFPLPDRTLRLQWLKESFPQADENTLADIAGGAADWTFAYLKELRVTAGVMALHDGKENVDDPTLLAAFDSLLAQFKAARNGFEEMNSAGESRIGFNEKREELRRRRA